MTPANLFTIAFLVLIVWRFVFAGLHRRPRVRALASPQKQLNSALGPDREILERVGAEVIADNRFETSPNEIETSGRKDRAEAYLRRIVALTGATQVGNAYVLDVGNTRFRVRYRHVSRSRDVADPKCADEETCFYPVQKGMPRAEEIATALLQLTNNPALFDKWAVQNGLAFKADGQVFTRAR